MPLVGLQLIVALVLVACGRGLDAHECPLRQQPLRQQVHDGYVKRQLRSGGRSRSGSGVEVAVPRAHDGLDGLGRGHIRSGRSGRSGWSAVDPDAYEAVLVQAVLPQDVVEGSQHLQVSV